MALAVKDAELIITKALPNGATSVTSDPIDLMLSSRGDLAAQVEFKISAPALATGDLGDAATMKYDILTSASSDMSSPTTVVTAAITQTGAGGAGASATTYTFRLPVDSQRYVAIKATNSAAGDASDKSLTFEAMF